jgi:hypothetical protein
LADTNLSATGPKPAHSAIKSADVLIGCVDNDMARLRLTALASDAQLPYFDLATEVVDSGGYGGRVIATLFPEHCAYCLGELDPEELALASLGAAQLSAHDRAYGIQTNPGEPGAAVVSINGVVASLGVTELMVHLTGLRRRASVLRYRGDLGTGDEVHRATYLAMSVLR